MLSLVFLFRLAQEFLDKCVCDNNFYISYVDDREYFASLVKAVDDVSETAVNRSLIESYTKHSASILSGGRSGALSALTMYIKGHDIRGVYRNTPARNCLCTRGLQHPG